MVGVGDTQGSKERGLELQLAFLIGVGFGFRVVSCEAYTLSYCTFQNIKIDFFRIAQILKSNKFGREFVGPNKTSQDRVTRLRLPPFAIISCSETSLFVVKRGCIF